MNLIETCILFSTGLVCLLNLFLSLLLRDLIDINYISISERLDIISASLASVLISTSRKSDDINSNYNGDNSSPRHFN